MKNYISLLSESTLFNKLSAADIPKVLKCLEGHTKTFDKGQIIYDYYDIIEYAGIVLEGEAAMIMLNSSGNQHNIRRILPGEIFGESYSCIPTEKSIAQIISNKKSTVLFLKFENLFKKKSVQCPYVSQVTANLLKETAKINIQLNTKIEILTQKHIREKLIVFLRYIKNEKSTVTIPLNRQGLANYLGVERSALSRELSNMKKEGLIDYSKNKITVMSRLLDL